MSNLFYPKLALMNLRKNAKTYIPYLLTCIGTILMFYNMSFLVHVKDIGQLSDSGSLRSILRFGAYVIGIFSVIFLFYTNSFLVKERKKEFGLYNILGMEKKHLAKVMFYETLITALLSLSLGILGGILLSKLMILLLFKIISFEVTFGFEIPLPALIYTILLFSAIFLLNLLNNIFQVHLAKPVELLKGGEVGEKEPKTRWLLALIGVLALGWGYYIAITTQTPLLAVNAFFKAVLLVMLGTYCLYTAGSIVLLKLLRKNKKYYYKFQHFISISGMMYRMKQNAVGLANICILSTAVIVMLSTTISLYVGVEDALKTRFIYDITVSAQKLTEDEVETLKQTLEEEIAKAQVQPDKLVYYRSKSFGTLQEGTTFTYSNLGVSYLSDKFAFLEVMPLEDYNRLENKAVELAEDQVLLYTAQGSMVGDSINLNGYELKIKEHLDSFLEIETDNSITNSFVLVVKDLDTLEKISAALVGEGEEEGPEVSGGLNFIYALDLQADSETQIALTQALNRGIRNLEIDGYADGREISRESFLSTYGGLFFLGLFLGLLFILATVLIIYYKQIAEGYNDKQRFEIMQKVGMSLNEVKKVIRSQVLKVFFLPLVTAAIHIAFAFKLITLLLAVFNLTNMPLFAFWTVITLLVFAVFYALVYALTARTYYKIVSQ